MPCPPSASIDVILHQAFPLKQPTTTENNDLKGAIPSQFAQLENLKELRLGTCSYRRQLYSDDPIVKNLRILTYPIASPLNVILNST